MAYWFRTYEIEGYQTICYNENRELRPLTNVLVKIADTVGIPVITAETAGEFYNRARALEERVGFFLRDENWQPRWLELADVTSHIGLRTNGKRLSRRAFERDVLPRLPLADDSQRRK